MEKIHANLKVNILFFLINFLDCNNGFHFEPHIAEMVFNEMVEK